MQVVASLRTESQIGPRKGYVAERPGPVATEASAPAETRPVWLDDCEERLSPGLEPLRF